MNIKINNLELTSKSSLEKYIRPNTPFTRRKNYRDRDLDRNPEDVPVYTGHSLFDTTKANHNIVHCSVIDIWIKTI